MTTTNSMLNLRMNRKEMIKICSRLKKKGYKLSGKGNVFDGCAVMMGLSPKTVSSLYYASPKRPKGK
jgi:hypothetical protein